MIKKSRHGKTLIELVVVIGVMSVAMTVAVRTIVLMMRADASGGKSLAASASLSRLAHQFRSDVHDAQAAELQAPAPNEAPLLLLTLNENSVAEYQPSAEKILRTVRRGEQTTSREEFRLPRGENRFVISDGDVPIVALVHVRKITEPNKTTSTEGPEREIRIEALRGRNHRFTK